MANDDRPGERSGPSDYLALLARGPAGGGLEDTGFEGAAMRAELLDRLRAEIAYVERKTGIAADGDALRAVLRGADEGLGKLFGDGPEADLGPAEVGGLEAVVRSDGSRPVLFVEDDFVDVLAPSIGRYAAVLSKLEDSVRAVCRSVGRVDDPSDRGGSLGYHGTAWMLGEGLVATNYHVLRAIAPGGTRADGRFHGRLTTGVSVHFGHEVGEVRPERRFPVRRVVGVGPEGAAKYAHPDAPSLNFDGLDLAVLELEPVPGRAFPEPNALARGDSPTTRGALASRGRGIYLVGYPGAQYGTTPDLFTRIFAGVKSFKRLAPGELTRVGDVPNDPRGWILAHDASTLGGNSGSALVDLDADGGTVLGLHFAGQADRQNWAHALERMTVELGSVLPPVGS